MADWQYRKENTMMYHIIILLFTEYSSICVMIFFYHTKYYLYTNPTHPFIYNATKFSTRM